MTKPDTTIASPEGQKDSALKGMGNADNELFEFPEGHEEGSPSKEEEEPQKTGKETPPKKEKGTEEIPPKPKEDTETPDQKKEKDELSELSVEDLVKKIKGLEEVYGRQTSEVGDARRDNQDLRTQLNRLEGQLEILTKKEEPVEKELTEEELDQLDEKYKELLDDSAYRTQVRLIKELLGKEFEKRVKPIEEENKTLKKKLGSMSFESVRKEVAKEIDSNPENIPFKIAEPIMQALYFKLSPEHKQTIQNNPRKGLEILYKQANETVLSPAIEQIMAKKGLTQEEATEELGKTLKTKAPATIKANTSGIKTGAKADEDDEVLDGIVNAKSPMDTFAEKLGK